MRVASKFAIYRPFFPSNQSSPFGCQNRRDQCPVTYKLVPANAPKDEPELRMADSGQIFGTCRQFPDFHHCFTDGILRY